jgi:hypothetical protein
MAKMRKGSQRMTIARVSKYHYLPMLVPTVLYVHGTCKYLATYGSHRQDTLFKLVVQSGQLGSRGSWAEMEPRWL